MKSQKLVTWLIGSAVVGAFSLVYRLDAVRQDRLTDLRYWESQIACLESEGGIVLD